MLPPIPSGVIQVTAQQDVPKPGADIAPVAPVQPSAGETSVGLDQRYRSESEALLREERRRRQRRGYSPEALARGDTDDVDREDLEELPRRGLWVDVEV